MVMNLDVLDAPYLHVLLQQASLSLSFIQANILMYHPFQIEILHFALGIINEIYT